MIDTGLLGRSSILERLEADEIFVPGTWSRDQLRGAGYDVRMASDLLFITDTRGKPSKYEIGEHRTDPVILEPSCVALLSTEEKFRIPEDLGAHVSVKWSLSRLGILVLTGGFINPGFGYREACGKLEPVPDERLHFLVVNLSSEPYVLIPKTTALASLQFVTIIGSAQNSVAKSFQGQTAKEEADSPLTALSLFPQLTSQKVTLEAFEERLSRVENGTQPLVTFGIYLVAITFLGVILNGALSLVSDARVAKLVHALPRNPSFTVLAAVVVVCLTLLSKWLLDLLVRGIGGIWQVTHKRWGK